jgi:hypothetical protein
MNVICQVLFQRIAQQLRGVKENSVTTNSQLGLEVATPRMLLWLSFTPTFLVEHSTGNNYG